MQDQGLLQATETGEDALAQQALRARGVIPAHIAIIMDGNGRWARERGHSRVAGHSEGAESVRVITEACAEIGVGWLTLYTFSTENWHRPRLEVSALMELLIFLLRKERETLMRNDIRLTAIGDFEKLPPQCRNELQEALAMTAANTRMTLCLALSYSGRWDLTQAARRIAGRVAAGTLRPDDVTEEMISQALATHGMPDPDLLIRSGGEFRVSNFLLWQMAYTEMYVTDAYWPAFRREQLYEAVRAYQDRDRRFGRVR